MGAKKQTREPAQPAELTTEFAQHASGFVFQKNRGGGPGCFLLLWLTGWTVGCVVLVGVAFQDPSMLLFATPFWAAWIAAACFLIWIYFGKEVLVLKSDKALFLRQAIITLSTREVPREEVRSFRECRSKHQENDEYLWGIEMKTLGKPVRFAFRLPGRERAWLIYQMNQSLEASNEQLITVGAERETGRPASVMTNIGLMPEHTLDEPPSDCTWSRKEGPEPAFSQRGAISYSALFGLLFINAFWNGIVSVFVVALFGGMQVDGVPEGAGWWGMFVFLIPFEVIGLGMFAALVLVLAEPFRTTRWLFERYRISRFSKWPMVARSKQWELAGLGRIELRGAGKEQNRPMSSLNLPSPDQGDFKLAFVTGDNRDLCYMDGLSKGEALWIAGVLLREREDWFR